MRTMLLLGPALSMLGVALVLISLVVTVRTLQGLERQVAPWGWRVLWNVGHLAARWSGHPFRGRPAESLNRNATGDFHGRPAVVLEHAAFRFPGISRVTVTGLAAPTRYAGLDMTVMPRSERLAPGSPGEDVPTGDAEFDAEWRVRSTDPRRALAILQPHVRQLLSQGGVPLRIVNGELLTWRPGKLDVAAIHQTLTWLAYADDVVALNDAPGPRATT